MERCDALGALSEELDRLTRRYGTPPMREVNALVAGWMRDAGMMTRQDTIGNLIGRYDGATPDAPTLLLGSHLDTVRDAGKYDGPLGVMTALALVERLRISNEQLPFALELYGFADEEGLRYHTAYLGSSVVAGVLASAVLAQTDGDGIPLADAIRTFGGNPTALAAARRGSDDLLGYVEVHIEQGPVLEAQGLPVGVVSAIQAQSRFSVTFTGAAGHAGTVPMHMRRDALVAASDFITSVATFAQGVAGLVATVGQIEAYPGASNVIPGRVTLSLDVRHQENAVRAHACDTLRRQAQTIAEQRRVAVAWDTVQEHDATPCDSRLMSLLSRAIQERGHPVLALPSGAGHDAVMMAHLTGITMLFVRCKGGISHAPAESVTTEDVAAALDVLESFVHLLAREHAGGTTP